MDKVILAEKLESLRRCVKRLEDKRVPSAAELRDDIDRQDILSLNLTRAVQLCVDMAAHLLSATEEPAPASMGESFDGLARLGLIDVTLNAHLKAAVGFRNVAIANIYNFIMEKLPNGYDTFVGERGVRLSGGQRQRIGIARALYHDPQVIVLDEATSALDNETERRIVEELDAMRGGRTLIVIAHRLTTVQKCHKVFLLDEGRLAAEGSYDTLNALTERAFERQKCIFCRRSPRRYRPTGYTFAESNTRLRGCLQKELLNLRKRLHLKNNSFSEPIKTYCSFPLRFSRLLIL